MSHEIPEPYVWDASFLVFYETLDTDHKGLFEAVWRVAENPDSQHYLKELKRLVTRHFKIEEEALKNAEYSELFAHKALHDDFIDKLAAISTPVTADKIQFAKGWLVNHIKNTDFKYKGKL